MSRNIVVEPRTSKPTTVAYPIAIQATARLRSPQAGDLTATLTPINEENVCDTSNPCQNNGTCVYDYRRKTYYCKCAPGYTNDNCTERIGMEWFYTDVGCTSGFRLRPMRCETLFERCHVQCQSWQVEDHVRMLLRQRLRWHALRAEYVC